MQAPAFQTYAADYYMDTADWTVQEMGIYQRLLLNQWTNNDLPADVSRLARIAGCSQKVFDHAWLTVAKKFTVNSSGRLLNLRLEETRQIQYKYSELQKEKAQKRWSNRDATALPREYRNDALLSSSSSSINKKEIYKEKKPCKQSLTDEQFFEMLKSNEAYKELNVDIQKAKCEAWCLTNQKMFSRRRFINWLNRAEKPIVKMVEESPSLKEYYRKYPEAKNV
jgi:uncharacterized protein YdaU (DUF1376 family)